MRVQNKPELEQIPSAALALPSATSALTALGPALPGRMPAPLPPQARGPGSASAGVLARASEQQLALAVSGHPSRKLSRKDCPRALISL